MLWLLPFFSLFFYRSSLAGKTAAYSGENKNGSSVFLFFLFPRTCAYEYKCTSVFPSLTVGSFDSMNNGVNGENPRKPLSHLILGRTSPQLIGTLLLLSENWNPRSSGVSCNLANSSTSLAWLLHSLFPFFFTQVYLLFFQLHVRRGSWQNWSRNCKACRHARLTFSSEGSFWGRRKKEHVTVGFVRHSDEESV